MSKLPVPAVESVTGGRKWHEMERVLDRAADVLNCHQYVVLSLFSACYFLITCYLASRKLFWFDELFTVYISRLHGLSAVWGALMKGVDFNPPLLYAFTQLSESVFGEGQIATRLPEIISFWIFCLCLFRFISVRISPLSGYIGMLFPLVTGAYFYAYEARSHGIVLGFAGIALVCWQAAAARSERRFGWILGLGGALALAMLTHSFALLLLVPIGFGELVRTVRARRIDWPIWLTLAASTLAILISLPLLRGVKSALGPSFFPATLRALVDSYKSHLEPAGSVLAATLFLLCIVQVVPPWRVPESNGERTLGEHEIVAILGFMGIPILVFLATRITGAPMLARYSTACVAGFACLLGAGVARRPALGFCVLLILLAGIGGSFISFQRSSALTEPSTSLPISTRLQEFKTKYNGMDAASDKDLPIVLLHNLEFLPIAYYAPPRLSSRMFYLVWGKADINGEGYRRLRECCESKCRVSSLSDFLASHQRFLAFGHRGDPKLDYFIRDGADVTIEKESSNQVLWSVSYKTKGRTSAVREAP